MYRPDQTGCAALGVLRLRLASRSLGRPPRGNHRQCHILSPRSISVNQMSRICLGTLVLASFSPADGRLITSPHCHVPSLPSVRCSLHHPISPNSPGPYSPVRAGTSPALLPFRSRPPCSSPSHTAAAQLSS